MELIDVILSSLLIFFGFISIAIAFSYISFKVKDRNGERLVRSSTQLENVPVSGVYPRMLTVEDAYKIPKVVAEKVRPERKNIFRHYSFDLGDKMHKLRLSRVEN